MNTELYTMWIVEGSIDDQKYIKKFSHTVGEDLGDLNWGHLIEAKLSIKDIKELQKHMVRHYEDLVPWYMDGVSVDDSNIVICAFGADDGEGGKIYLFNKNDKKVYEQVIEYGVSKGIPREQMDFLETK